jgi:hypothetical protein
VEMLFSSGPDGTSKSPNEAQKLINMKDDILEIEIEYKLDAQIIASKRRDRNGSR